MRKACLSERAGGLRRSESCEISVSPDDDLGDHSHDLDIGTRAVC